MTDEDSRVGGGGRGLRRAEETLERREARGADWPVGGSLLPRNKVQSQQQGPPPPRQATLKQKTLLFSASPTPTEHAGRDYASGAFP